MVITWLLMWLNLSVATLNITLQLLIIYRYRLNNQSTNMIFSFNYNLTILFGDQLNLILDYPKHACLRYDHGSPNHIQALIKQ